MKINTNNRSIISNIRKMFDSLLLLIFAPFFLLGAPSDELIRYYSTPSTVSLITETETDEKSSKETEERTETNDDPKESKNDGGDGHKNPFQTNRFCSEPNVSFIGEYLSLRLTYSKEFSFIKSLFPSLFLLDHSFLE